MMPAVGGPKELPRTFLRLVGGKVEGPDVEKLVQEALGTHRSIRVDRLGGGITNQLLMAEEVNGDKRVLVRMFGRGTDMFIDRDREFAVHCALQRLQLAPLLYARFGNGLVYAYMPGRPTDYQELSTEPVMRAVARRLAKWHAQLKREDVAALMPSHRVGDLWEVLGKWVHLCPPGILGMGPEELEKELDWIQTQLSKLGSPLVMGHCDLLSGNIIVAPHGQSIEDATFIDYEYAMPCPRAFDIANHFQEWQGFDCDRSRVPEPVADDPALRKWGEFYLETSPNESLETLVNELRAWWGMPGFYWGVWSAIQSQSSEIDFDYAAYAQQRFGEYSDWKRRIWPTLVTSAVV